MFLESAEPHMSEASLLGNAYMAQNFKKTTQKDLETEQIMKRTELTWRKHQLQERQEVVGKCFFINS